MPAPPLARQEEALGGLCQAAVCGPRGGARLSVSIHPPGRHIEQPPPPLRRCRGHLPLQGLSQGRRRTAAGHDPRRRRVHPPLPPPRPASRIPPHPPLRSEEHTSELQSLMRISYAVFCLKK